MQEKREERKNTETFSNMFFGTEVQHSIRIPAEMKAASKGLGALWGEAEEYFKGRSCCLRDFLFAMFDTSQGISPCCSEQ